ncbi:hypothetical protein PRIPAC_92732 [Pristionchus pacificus]|uniref:Uncharacterized protein n=1 Tax=Pristionchus pacificus TaxID=54126 RepID=A0A2A6BQC0_PRIPA|nr:hypothetical protein PRIPAC_92732 [Pristionchus pacificus]|eukprot:PDM68142.1 hypothetical protein PRIPAC_46186 [Pristionchus pacificus]
MKNMDELRGCSKFKGVCFKVHDNDVADPFFNNTESHFLAVQTLDAALTIDSLLQKCLSYGLLAVSQHFARAHYSFDNGIDDVAPIFRQCLDKHPEFKQLFKEWTVGGDLRTETAQIGAAIADRVKRAGQWYILERDDDDVWEL